MKYTYTAITTRLTFANMVFLFLLFCSTAFAETVEVTGYKGTQKNFSVSLTPVYEFNAGLDRGGSFEAFKLIFDAGSSFRINESLQAGLHVGYDYSDYQFTTLAALGMTAPWDKLHRLELGGSLIYSFNTEWSLLTAPALQYYRAEDAGWGNALTYGGVVAVNRKFTPNLTLGFGAGAFSALETVNVFPLVIINWKISDRLLLANPFRPGPAGRSGLELSYRLDDGWDTGIGGAYRSNRFRLSGNSTNPNGIGEVSSVPLWLRLSRSVGSSVNLDLYGGVALGGELRLEDRAGNYLASEKHDAAPFVALSVSGRF